MTALSVSARCLDRSFLMFHLGDTYHFFNELVKAQATTREENTIFHEYMDHKKVRERFYGRMYACAAIVPWFFSLFSRKSIAYKLVSGYLLYTCLDALYDMGVYTYFFIHGPKYMRQCVELPPNQHFGSI